MNTLWGIDLGGTKIEGLVIRPGKKPETVCRLRIPTEAQKGYEHILQQIGKLVGMMSNQTGSYPRILGIGTPGTIDPHSGLLKNSNTACLNDKPIKEDLERIMGVPVRVANDANCFALAEAKLGVVQKVLPKAEVVFGVIMGTGVGGGVVVNGRIVQGGQGIAGEWGHNVLDLEGDECYCGKQGCVEKVISGPAIEKYWKTLAGETNGLTFKDAVMRPEAEYSEATKQTLERLVTMFGKAISVVINVIDPEVIVIGGGLGNIAQLYSRGHEEAKKHVFNNRLETLFLRPELGDSAGVFGAAMLTEEELSKAS
ncbi:MAG: ROK family protein [Bacteroidota bacterium]